MAAITSAGSGDWSVGATWVGGVSPVLGDSVIIASGHTVTVDGVYRVGDDTATAVQVNGGTLKFSRTVNSGLSVRGGVRNGTTSGSVWDMGTVADPIPSSVTCTLLLNDSATLANAKYDFDWGRTNNVAGQFHANGASKTAATLTTSAATATSTTLVVADATGWAVGDRIGMHGDAPNMASQRESRFISAISGSGPYTLSLNTGLTNAHASGTRVVNLTRNVRVGCYSSTVQNGRFYVRVTSSFSCNWVEFSHGWANTVFEAGFSVQLTALSVSGRGTMQGLALHDFTFASAPGGTQTSGTGAGVRFLDNNFGLSMSDSVGYLGTAAAFFTGGQTNANAGGTLSRIYVIGGSHALGTLQVRTAGIKCFDSEFYCVTYATNDAGNTFVYDFARCKMFAPGGASQSNGHIITADSCEFLAPTSGYGGIFRVASYSTAIYRSPTIDANALALGDSIVNNPSLLSGGNVKLLGVNGNATDNRYWYWAGLAESSAALVRASSKNFRMRPGAASTLSTVPFVYSFSFPVAVGVSYTLIPYMQADATYGTAIAPTISYAAPGVSVTDSMPSNTGTWNKMLRTITPTESGICTVTVTCQGSAGTVYFDGVPDAEFVLESRHYGYVLDNVTPYVIADPFITVTNETTVGAYTGISINDVTQEVTITSAHTTEQIYDYCKWSRCQAANLSQPDFLTTADGETYVSTYDIIISGSGSITGKLQAPNGSSGVLTVSGLTGASAAAQVYVEDDSGVQQTFQSSVTGTFTYPTPFGSSGTWKVVINKPGYWPQVFQFNPQISNSYTVTLLPIQNPDGTVLYSGGAYPDVTVLFDTATNCTIELAGTSINIQEVIDATQDAYSTADGMAWLANDNGESTAIILSTGQTLVLSARTRLWGAVSGAALNGYAVSQDNIVEDPAASYPVRYASPPASGGGGATAAEIWSYVSRTLNPHGGVTHLP